MADLATLGIPDEGRLATNIAHFGRALRKAGIRVGPDRVISAIRAVEAAGFTDRTDFYWALHASFVSRPEDRAVFAQTFRLFWRDPRFLEHMMAMLLPSVRGVSEERVADAAARRAAEALTDGKAPDLPTTGNTGQDETEIEIDATATASSEERLRTLDFEQMTTEEMRRAKRAIASFTLPVRPLRARRTRSAEAGRLPDWRRTLRNAMRRGGALDRLALRDRLKRPPDLVVLCDISGSMATYSRMVLHFLHSVSNRQGQGWGRVHAFTFGTSLTNISRHLRKRDVDSALAAAGAEAQDWQGGTRIGECLHIFNRDWSRRVLGQGAVVVLVSDGLERGDAKCLAQEMERLHLTARRIVWLNPLLRWDGFAPRAQGILAMLPHVDTVRTSHSLASLESLAAAIAAPADPGDKLRLMAMIGQ